MKKKYSEYLKAFKGLTVIVFESDGLYKIVATGHEEANKFANDLKAIHMEIVDVFDDYMILSAHEGRFIRTVPLSVVAMDVVKV